MLSLPYSQQELPIESLLLNKMESLNRDSVDFAWKVIEANHPLRKISVWRALAPTINIKHILRLDRESINLMKEERGSNSKQSNERNTVSIIKQKDQENFINKISNFSSSLYNKLIPNNKKRSDDVENEESKA